VGKIIAIICLNDVFEEMLDAELKDDDVHGTLRNVLKLYVKIGSHRKNQSSITTSKWKKIGKEGEH